MLNALLSPTRFASFERITTGEFTTAVRYLGREPKKVALVRDSRASDQIDELARGLAGRFELAVLDRVKPDPLASDISFMAEASGISNFDIVIGVGGGSVMDSAKALAMLAENGGRLEEYLGPNPARRVEKKGKPLLLVPTTAGTGSEATKVGVYTSDTGRKYTLGSPYLQADAAILSGSLASTMPPSLAASTGFDALSHALESIWNKNATPLTIEASARAAALVLQALLPAYAAAEAAARNQPGPRHDAIALRMLEAAAAAGVAFSITGTAAAHALSFVLSEDWHIPHGTACAFTLDDLYVIQAKNSVVAGRLARIGALLRPDDETCWSPEYVFDVIAGLKKRLSLPGKFADLGIKLDSGRIPEIFGRAFDDPKMGNSYPEAVPEEIFGMLRNKI